MQPTPEQEDEDDDGAVAAGDQSAAPVPELPRQPGTLAIAWNFFIVFFSSLAPQQPPALIAN